MVLNLRGNNIRDEGLQVLSQAILQNETLEELDISLNDLTPVGICYLAEVLPTSGIRILNLAKNLLGDESLVMIANKIANFKDQSRLERIDISSSRLADKGVPSNKSFIRSFTSLNKSKTTPIWFP
jgi:Ran GTPase-activating protein (RanGAP) involved in mRNA processing and transport